MHASVIACGTTHECPAADPACPLVHVVMRKNTMMVGSER
jgi:hypothetical protein